MTQGTSPKESPFTFKITLLAREFCDQPYQGEGAAGCLCMKLSLKQHHPYTKPCRAFIYCLNKDCAQIPTFRPKCGITEHFPNLVQEEEVCGV